MNKFSSKTLFRLKPAGFSIFHQQKKIFIKPPLALLSSPNNTYFSKARAIITSQQRYYSAEGGLSRQNIESRIIDIVKAFDKVDESKVNSDARFADDLGLDSLDTVEVVMNIEEDFSIEIPDKEADEIRSIKDAVDYIAKREDAH
ncbi:acyl carrier protein-like protein [Glomus cerebriforme]|uniref:Acyl carrier protein n=1 Tax=Glomus cerebriforme TaxID=658196 RepID=A0A397T3F9_9GLOM|nr:acyl carrier protein-like protein [Glomus cerebriforme]